MFTGTDKEWNDAIQGYRNKLATLPIPDDITPTQAKHILSQIDIVYATVRPMYGDVKSRKDYFESLIERVRRKAEANGSNVEKRKAAGIEAVENIEDGKGGTMNLYDAYYKVNKRKEDLESILDVMKRKSEMIITMSGLLKMESQFSGYN